jgi:hypothetical protein
LRVAYLVSLSLLSGFDPYSFPALLICCRQGWTEDITKARSRSQLPKAAQEYLAFLEKESGIKATWVGVGPGREGMVTV